MVSRNTSFLSLRSDRCHEFSIILTNNRIILTKLLPLNSTPLFTWTMFALRFITVVAFLVWQACSVHQTTNVDTNPLIKTKGNGYGEPNQPQCSCACHCEVPQCNAPNPWSTPPPTWVENPWTIAPSPQPSSQPLPQPSFRPISTSFPSLDPTPQPTRPTLFPTTGTLNFPSRAPQIGSQSLSMGSTEFSFDVTL